MYKKKTTLCSSRLSLFRPWGAFWQMLLYFYKDFKWHPSMKAWVVVWDLRFVAVPEVSTRWTDNNITSMIQNQTSNLEFLGSVHLLFELWQCNIFPSLLSSVYIWRCHCCFSRRSQVPESFHLTHDRQLWIQQHLFFLLLTSCCRGLEVMRGHWACRRDCRPSISSQEVITDSTILTSWQLENASLQFTMHCFYWKVG